MKKDTKTKALIIEQLKKTPVIETSCQKIGITRMTLSRWKKADPDFAKQIIDAIVEGRLLVNDLAEHQLIGAVKEQNMPAIVYWLKNHHQDYKTRIQIDGSIKLIEELSPKQKELVRRAQQLVGINLSNNHEQSKPESK